MALIFLCFRQSGPGLAAVGIHRPWWRPGSLQVIFSTELEQRRTLYPASFVRNLAKAMELHHSVDNNDSHVSLRRATQMVRTAAEFVNRVKEVIRNA
jgi:hypothetical protein